MRGALAAAVVIVMGCAIAGIGMGSTPAQREPVPAAAQVAAARERIAAGGDALARGRALFQEQGCDRCHAIAAVGSDGRLGPRLDRLDDDADDILESIADPRDEIADGYPELLMPADFDERMDETQLAALAAFVVAASGGEAEEDEGGEAGGEDSGRGRGRGRGRSEDGG